MGISGERRKGHYNNLRQGKKEAPREFLAREERGIAGISGNRRKGHYGNLWREKKGTLRESLTSKKRKVAGISAKEERDIAGLSVKR